MYIAAALCVFVTLFAAAGAQPLEGYEQCYSNRFRCKFETVIGGKRSTWDMNPLCRPAGKEYVVHDSSGDYWAFNICGEVSYPCIPSDWSSAFAHGTAHQYLMGDPRTTLVPGNAACQSLVVDPTTGKEVCSTQCIMNGRDLSPNWVLSGSAMTTVGGPLAIDASSPFNCRFDPSTGCSVSRYFNFHFECDPSSDDPSVLSDLTINETDTCAYTLFGRTKAACMLTTN